jgi:hypothetical protein
MRAPAPPPPPLPFPCSSTYGISRYTDAILAPATLLGDSNDYGKLRIAAGRMHVLHMTTTTGASAVLRFTGVPRSAVTRPAAIFTSTALGSPWRDMDVTDDGSTVVVCGPGGLQVLASSGAGGSGTWAAVTSNADRTPLVGCGFSVDGTTVYATSASGTGSELFSFDVASGSWNNNALAILTAPAGTQFRGVAAAPIPASSTPTVTPSSSATASNTPSVTSSASATVSSGLR